MDALKNTFADIWLLMLARNASIYFPFVFVCFFSERTGAMGCADKNMYEGKRAEKTGRKSEIYKKQLAGDKKACKK